MASSVKDPAAVSGNISPKSLTSPIENFKEESSSSTYSNLASTSKVSPTEKVSSKNSSKRGILGFPKRSRMLFSFTKSELWSSGEESDDEEFKPEAKKQNCGDGLQNGTYEYDDYVEEDESPSSPERKKLPKSLKLTKSPAKKRSITKKITKKNASSKQKAPLNKVLPKCGKLKNNNGTVIKKTSNSNTEPSKSNKLSTICNYMDFNILFQKNNLDFAQDLPEDVLIHIFDMLADLEDNRTQTFIRLSQVCESWRKVIITTPILWQKLDLSKFDEKKFPLSQFLNSEFTNLLFTCVKHVNLSGWSSQYAERIIDIVAEQSNFDLESLNVRCCRNISATFLQSIMEKCSNLQSVDLSGITYYSINTFNLDFFAYMQSSSKNKQSKSLPDSSTKQSSSSQNCQNPFSNSTFRPIFLSRGSKLKSLFLSENLIPTLTIFFGLVMDTCPNLEVIDISNVVNLGKEFFISIEKFQQSCPKLRVLRAAKIKFKTSTKMNSAFPMLEELSIPQSKMNGSEDLSLYTGHSDAIIEHLTRGSENLKLLDVRGAGNITSRGLLKIPSWSIKHLWISNCRGMADETLGLVFTKWGKWLEDVDLSWNKSEQCLEACIRAICENDKEDCRLRSIQLRGSAVSFEMIKQLILFCPLLTSIDLQSCRSLPRGIKRSFFDDEFEKLKQEIKDGKYT